MKNLMITLIAALVLAPMTSWVAAAEEEIPEIDRGATSVGPIDYGAIHDYGTPMMTPLHSVVDQYLRHKTQIGLTPEQVTALKNLRGKYQREIVLMNADLDAEQMRLNNLLNEDDIDLNEVQTLNSSIEKLQSQIRTKNIELFVNAQKVLTPDQVKKAAGLGIKQTPSEYFGRHLSAGY